VSKLIDSYHLFGKEFQFEWECPGTWNELDTWQLRRIAAMEGKHLHHLQYDLKAFLILFKVRKSIWRSFLMQICFSPDYRLFADFLSDKDQYLTVNPILKFRGLEAVAHWKDMDYMQWTMAEYWFAEYGRTKATADLNKLVATLFSINGNYSDEQHNDLHQRVGRWPMDVRMAMLIFYAGSQQDMKKKYPKVFKKRGGGSGGHYGKALSNLMLSMAKNDVSKMEEVGKVKAPIIMQQLEKNIEDAERTERSSK
jgi:hypothetical protein